MIKYFILFVSFLNFNNFIQSQEINLGGSCEIIDSNNPCYGRLNYTTFYLQKSETTNQLITNITNINSLLDLTTTDCKSNATLLLCLKYFPKCSTFNETLNNGSTIIVDLPSLPCNSFCLESQKPCQFYIDNYFKELSCDSKFTNGIPMFPDNSTQFDIGSGTNIDTMCIGKESLNINDSVIIEIQCPKPLLNAKDYVIEGKDLYYFVTDECIIDCPFLIYPKEKMDRLDVANYLLTIISFITCTFMIITFGILPNKITHRMESILSFSVGGWISSFSLFIQSAQHDFNCSVGDPGRFKSQSDNLCLFVGLLFQFGALAAIFWAPMIAFDFYITSIMKKIHKFGIYRIVIWSLIIILSAIPAFGGKYGSTVATTGCWITSDDNSAWQYICFYLPSWLSIGIICIFSILSVWNITKMYLQTPNNRILFFNGKIIVTIIVLLFDLTFSSSLKFYMEDRMDLFFESIISWSTCISTSFDPSSCELKLPGYDLKALNVVVVSILGFSIFIGYGLDPIVIQIWKDSKRFQYFLNKIGLSRFIKLNSSQNTETTISNDSSRSTSSKPVKMSSLNIAEPSSQSSYSTTPTD